MLPASVDQGVAAPVPAAAAPAPDVGPERLVELWMASSGHRRNILDPALTHLGSGAARRDDGRWYASHVFLGR